MRTRFCVAEANRLRQEASITAPPVDVEEIASGLLLEIKHKKPWLWKGRAMLRRETGEIWVNAEENLEAQRFSIGHEIGHFILHPDQTVFSEHVDLDSPEYASDPMKALDDEADYFSSVLLVPPDWLRKDVASRTSPARLAERYLVSDPVIFIALKQHRLLSKVALPPR